MSFWAPPYVAIVAVIFAVRVLRLLSRFDRRPHPTLAPRLDADGDEVASGALATLASRARNAADDPRWGSSRGEQLTGQACAECQERIVVESQAKRCAECKQPVHRKGCVRRHRAEAHPAERSSPYR
jgi:hypothetical protein